mmetsp:Transcript_24313/g.48486  ORF Transcript_24313/g.48486 Transcript_24313/m.48486 type:complete len:210 (-) Transcript_24313:529-1158(-)
MGRRRRRKVWRWFVARSRALGHQSGVGGKRRRSQRRAAASSPAPAPSGAESKSKGSPTTQRRGSSSSPVGCGQRVRGRQRSGDAGGAGQGRRMAGYAGQADLVLPAHARGQVPRQTERGGHAYDAQLRGGPRAALPLQALPQAPQGEVGGPFAWARRRQQPHRARSVVLQPAQHGERRHRQGSLPRLLPLQPRPPVPQGLRGMRRAGRP